MNEVYWEKAPITGDSARFFLSDTGLLMVCLDDGTETRAFLSRAFPFKTEDEYICVKNSDEEELGMIRTLGDFPKEQATLLREELRKKYFAPKIRRILRLNERYGASYWVCDTDMGELKFTVQNTYRSLIRAGEDRLFVVDHDGCRYEIESLSAFDKKSYSKIELYL